MRRRVAGALVALCAALALCPAAALAGGVTLTYVFAHGAASSYAGTATESPFEVSASSSGSSFYIRNNTGCEPYAFLYWQATDSNTGEDLGQYGSNEDITLSRDVTLTAVYLGPLAICGADAVCPQQEYYEFTAEAPEGVSLGDAFTCDGVEYPLRYTDSAVYGTVSASSYAGKESFTLAVSGTDASGNKATMTKTVQVSRDHVYDENGTCACGAEKPTLAIGGEDVVCAQQDYEFTVTAPEGVTLETEFGYDTGMMGSSADLTVDENNAGRGVMDAEWYDLETNRFTLTAYGHTAGGTPVTGTKTVQVSRDHVYVDGVCGCGAKRQYAVTYDSAGYEVGVPAGGVKTHGEDYTLSDEAIDLEGCVHTGWTDGRGNFYELGGAYTADEDVTLYPVFEQVLTVSVPFTVAVGLGDVGEPGEATFELEVVGANAGEEACADVSVSGSVIVTDGAGVYSGAMTFTGPESQIRAMLSEGAFVRQADDGAEGWTVDDAVYGLVLDQAAAPSSEDSAPAYALSVVPAVEDGEGYSIDWDAYLAGGALGQMSFTNTYSAHVYGPEHDANGHWEECACGAVRNEGPHSYGDWTVTREATQQEAGLRERSCSVCGYTQAEEIGKLPAADDPEGDDPAKGDPAKGDPAAGTSIPRTGDDGSAAPWAALLAAGCGALAGAAALGRKARSER